MRGEVIVTGTAYERQGWKQNISKPYKRDWEHNFSFQNRRRISAVKLGMFHTFTWVLWLCVFDIVLWLAVAARSWCSTITGGLWRRPDGVSGVSPRPLLVRRAETLPHNGVAASIGYWLYKHSFQEHPRFRSAFVSRRGRFTTARTKDDEDCIDMALSQLFHQRLRWTTYWKDLYWEAF